MARGKEISSQQWVDRAKKIYENDQLKQMIVGISDRPTTSGGGATVVIECPVHGTSERRVTNMEVNGIHPCGRCGRIKSKPEKPPKPSPYRPTRGGALIEAGYAAEFMKSADLKVSALLLTGELSTGSNMRASHRCMAERHHPDCDGWTIETTIVRIFGYGKYPAKKQRHSCRMVPVRAAQQAAKQEAEEAKKEARELQRSRKMEERAVLAAKASELDRAERRASWEERNEARKQAIRNVNPNGPEPEWIYGKSTMTHAIVVCPRCGARVRKEIQHADKSHVCRACWSEESVTQQRSESSRQLAADKSRRKIIADMLSGAVDGTREIGIFYFIIGQGKFDGLVKPGISEIGVAQDRTRRRGGNDGNPVIATSLKVALTESYVLHQAERPDLDLALEFCRDSKNGGHTEVCVLTDSIIQRRDEALSMSEEDLTRWWRGVN